MLFTPLENLMIASPLEQFNIVSLIPISLPFGIDLTITNSALISIIGVSLFILLLKLTVEKSTLVPTHWQSIIEMYYESLLGLVKENIGKKGLVYFPFIFTLFSFILTLNLIGMIPYNYSVTSQIIVSIGLSFTIWVFVTLTGFVRHGINYISMFFPQGAPLALAPLLVCIELVSYFARAISLGLRLAANISAGHLLLAIIGGFGWDMLKAGGLLMVGSVVPIGLIWILMFLEIAVAGIQAYVLTLLTTIYLNDAENLH